MPSQVSINFSLSKINIDIEEYIMILNKQILLKKSLVIFEKFTNNQKMRKSIGVFPGFRSLVGLCEAQNALICF